MMYNLVLDCTIIKPCDSQDTNDEKLYGIMEKTLRLLEMGFSENQVSFAIEKSGKSDIICSTRPAKKNVECKLSFQNLISLFGGAFQF